MFYDHNLKLAYLLYLTNYLQVKTTSAINGYNCKQKAGRHLYSERRLVVNRTVISSNFIFLNML
jgi:hypothetical protein